MIKSQQHRDVVDFFWEWQQRAMQRQRNPVADLALDKCEELFQCCDWKGFAYWHAIYCRERFEPIGSPLTQTHVVDNYAEGQMSDASFKRRMIVFAICALMAFFALVGAVLDMMAPSGPLNFHLHWGVGSEVVIHSRLVLIGSAELAAIVLYLFVRTLSRRPTKKVASQREFSAVFSKLHFPFIVRAYGKPTVQPGTSPRETIPRDVHKGEND
jgi:hypothetical protein